LDLLVSRHLLAFLLHEVLSQTSKDLLDRDIRVFITFLSSPRCRPDGSTFTTLLVALIQKSRVFFFLLHLILSSEVLGVKDL
jgi:hypothetical protein